LFSLHTQQVSTVVVLPYAAAFPVAVSDARSQLTTMIVGFRPASNNEQHTTLHRFERESDTQHLHSPLCDGTLRALIR